MKNKGSLAVGLFIGLAVLAVVIGGLFISTRNKLVVADEAVNAAWSQVENVMQRRADLVF